MDVDEAYLSNNDQFYKNYRDSLKQYRDASMNQLQQQRSNDFAGIMSSANKSGMLYSNLPQRTKIQYDTSKYYPAMVGVQNTYQTGLDSLRTQGAGLANQIKYYQEAIADMNEYAALYAQKAAEKDAS